MRTEAPPQACWDLGFPEPPLVCGESRTKLSLRIALKLKLAMLTLALQNPILVQVLSAQKPAASHSGWGHVTCTQHSVVQSVVQQPA